MSGIPFTYCRKRHADQSRGSKADEESPRGGGLATTGGAKAFVKQVRDNRRAGTTDTDVEFSSQQAGHSLRGLNHHVLLLYLNV